MSLRKVFSDPPRARPEQYSGARRARRKFLNFFPHGFADQRYLDWERNYKWQAHLEWQRVLEKQEFATLLKSRKYAEIAARAVRIESRTNLLFSFEKMALRDAVKSPKGARLFSEGLHEFLYGGGSDSSRFETWLNVVSELPRKQTRVLTWPVVTVFGFIASPDLHVFLKPMVTQEAASEYGFEFNYVSSPSWECYENLLDFARIIKRDLTDLRPRDMIDLQSFIWVQGSSEYAEQG